MNKLCSTVKENWKHTVILFWFGILPVTLVIWLFWYNIESPIQVGQSRYTIDTTELEEPNFKNTIRKIFQSPFGLSYYSICIKNISSSSSTLTHKSIPLDVTLLLKDKGGNTIKELPTIGGKRDCYEFKIKDDSTLYFQSLSEIQIPSTAVYENKIDFNFDKAKPLKKERFALSIIFYLTYTAFVALYLSLNESRKKYLKKQ